MLSYNDIKQVHLEISSRCNASCPECPRNLHGVEGIIDDYPVCSMTLEQVKQIFSASFLNQLSSILINGNYGDFITCKDGLSIVEYFRKSNPNLEIRISTNASGQPKIWEKLAELGAVVIFRLDGLEDTHHLYRQNTDFNLIIENAEKFISAGGNAEWHMIEFDFNEKQRDQALMRSVKKGFKRFQIVDGGRNNTVVFNKDGEFSHTIGSPSEPKDLYYYYNAYQYSKTSDKTDMYKNRSAKNISCMAKNGKEIYVAANGEVYPCCFTGFYPRTNNSRPGNNQLMTILKDFNNNALEVGLENAINWFSELEKTWNIPEVWQGRNFICNETCGS
jgi:MoaA/NifB/PqqE/SkfB family radical SAM enzyme